MRKIKEVLRLTHDGHLNTRQVALSLNISRSTVKDYQARAQRAGLCWPLPETLTEEALEQKLFPPLVGIEAPGKALPDFDYIYRELKSHKKFNLTLDQLVIGRIDIVVERRRDLPHLERCKEAVVDAILE